MWNNQGGFQSYDQGGGAGGQGGYMSPGGFGTPQQSQERKSRSRAQNILPVTVAEIINATQNEDKFFTGDIEMLQVTLVGLVRAVKETPTRLDYEIDDLSGPPLEVKQFVDNDYPEHTFCLINTKNVREFNPDPVSYFVEIDHEVFSTVLHLLPLIQEGPVTQCPLQAKESIPDEERVQPCRENTYVRVCGTVRSFGGKKSVVAFKMVPVLDMNELTYHLLEVIHSHASLSSSQTQVSNGMPTGTSSHTGGYGDTNEGVVSGLSSIQNQVHMAIRSNPTAEGASVESVCKQIRGVPEKAIRDAIEFLSSEGHIYSTIDDDHYKATDS